MKGTMLSDVVSVLPKFKEKISSEGDITRQQLFESLTKENQQIFRNMIMKEWMNAEGDSEQNANESRADSRKSG